MQVTFGQAGAAFLSFRRGRKAERTADKHAWLLGVLRPLHARPLDEIRAPEVLQVLRKLETAGKAETARRAGQFTARVFRYAIGEGWCDNNPARDLRGNLEGVVVESHAGITDPDGFGRLMRLVDMPGHSHRTVYNALRLLARTALRPGELRRGLWQEVDMEKAEWRIPAERMKMRRPHLVPLSTQAKAILWDQWEVSGEGEFIFPGIRSGRPLSDAAMGVALKNMFISPDAHVPHGFRVSFSSMLNERGEEAAVIELQLSHAKQDKIAGIYDRSQRVPDRKNLMQKWSNWIDELKAAC
jgi:integrase